MCSFYRCPVIFASDGMLSVTSFLGPTGFFKSCPNLQCRISVWVGVKPRAAWSRWYVDAPDLTDLHGPVCPKRPDVSNLLFSHHDAPLKDSEASIGRKPQSDNICGYFRPLCQVSIYVTHLLWPSRKKPDSCNGQDQKAGKIQCTKPARRVFFRGSFLRGSFLESALRIGLVVHWLAAHRLRTAVKAQATRIEGAQDRGRPGL
jgi:hypothetical protein